MNFLFKVLLITLFSSSSFAYQCGSLFSAPQPKKNHELINSLKRIRNFGYFSSFVLIDAKHSKMNVVVFDIAKDGVIEGRPSLNDFILELRNFASDIRFVYNEQTKDQVLISRLAIDPKTHRENNLLFSKFDNKISLIENLKKSETIDESFNLEIFQSVLTWLASPGKQLNVIVLPEVQKEAFIEMALKVPHFELQSFDSVINKMDPIN